MASRREREDGELIALRPRSSAPALVEGDAAAGESADEPLSDADLAKALESGREGALAALYDRYARLVFGVARTMSQNTQEAEDLTQEVFFALWNRCNYDSARGSMASLLVSMTRSRAIDRIRSRDSKLRLHGELRRIEDSDPRESLDPREAASLGERCGRVREALSLLSADQRRVLELAYYRGLSQTEIAGELAMPLGTVKSWARKGLIRLRDALRDHS